MVLWAAALLDLRNMGTLAMISQSPLVIRFHINWNVSKGLPGSACSFARAETLSLLLVETVGLCWIPSLFFSFFLFTGER